MSVLVKGMEMPQDCRECCMAEYHINTGKTWCKPADGLLADTYRPIMYDGRPDWCPLVELPEKHGDLIDRNDLKKEYAMGFDCNNCVSNQKSCQYDAFYAKMDFCLMLDDAPVVIEAEEAKE